MKAHIGFTYRPRIVSPSGVVLMQFEPVFNLITTQGLNHILTSAIGGGSQQLTWYIGLYEGNYTPTIADVMSTFPAAATETTAYSESTRELFVPGTATAGVLDNDASPAEFTFTAAKTLYGVFIASGSAKGATSGTLLSAAKFATPRVVDIGTVFQVPADITLVNP